MSKASYTLYIIIVTFILAGCQGESRYHSRLCALDSVLVQSPDSVYKVLVAEEKEAQQQSRSDRMYYELLRADAQNKAYIDFTTDSLMLQVADYYDHHGTANQQMRAHYLLGCTYRDLGDTPMELQCFLEATEKADTTQKDCDLYTLAAIYGQMADIYHSQYLPEEELKVLEMCRRIAVLGKDTISATNAYQLQIRAYYYMNMPDSVLSIAEKTYREFLNYGVKEKATAVIIPTISILIDKGEYKKAAVYFSIYDSLNVNSQFNKSNSIYLYEKGRYMLNLHKVDSAYLLFNRLLSFGEKEAAYQGLLSIYEKKRQTDSILKYSKLYTIANDSSFLQSNSNTIAQMTAMYNYGRQQRIATMKTKEAAHTETISRYIVICSVLLISCITYLVFRIKRSKDIKITEMTINYMDALVQKEHLEADIIKERHEMEEKITFIKKQHAGQLDSLKQNIHQIQEESNKSLSKKEKELETLQYQLKYYSETIDIGNTDKRLTAFMKTELFKKLKASLNFKTYEMKLTMADWIRFWDLYYNYFPNFHTFIMGKTLLNNDEKKLCLLLILGFSPKQMSIIFDKSMPRISNLRASINKKLFRENSASTLDGNVRTIFYHKQKSMVSSQ